jgi:hypothetical protein
VKRNIVALVMLCSAAALGMGAPAQAEMGKNSIGPSVQFGNIGNSSTFVGIDSKFGVSDNLSVRPFIYFPSGGTLFGSGLTYDFNLQNSNNTVQITPYLGGAVEVASASNGGSSTTSVGFVGGADFDVTESIQVRGGLFVPLSNNNGRPTTFNIGAGFRF